VWFPELFKDVQFYTSAASNGYGALERICLAWGIFRADRLDYNPGGTAAGDSHFFFLVCVHNLVFLLPSNSSLNAIMNIYSQLFYIDVIIFRVRYLDTWIFHAQEVM
jgi:hypothetical protein